MAEAGVSDSCDKRHLVRGITPLLRNHVTFEYPQIQSELELADQFKKYILSQNAVYDRYKASKITRDKSGVTFSFCWYENKYYAVWFNRIELANTWHIFHSPEHEDLGSKSVSLMIDEWLKSNKNFTIIKWYTHRVWKKFLSEWQETPI